MLLYMELFPWFPFQIDHWFCIEIQKVFCVLILYPATLLNLLLFNTDFLGESLGFPICEIVSPVKQVILFFLCNLDPFCFFFLPNRSGWNLQRPVGHEWREWICFPSFATDAFAVGFSYVVLVTPKKYPSIPSLWSILIKKFCHMPFLHQLRWSCGFWHSSF